MLTPQQISEIQKMGKEGASFHSIAKETKHSFKTIKKYLDNTIPENDTITDDISINPKVTTNIDDSIAENTKVTTETQLPESKPTAVIEPNLETLTGPITPDNPNPEASPIKPDEALVEVRGVPIGKKISFTPKNLTMWEWFKSSYEGWADSDISEFVNQCMGYFFSKGLGAKMKIEVVQEMA